MKKFLAMIMLVLVAVSTITVGASAATKKSVHHYNDKWTYGISGLNYYSNYKDNPDCNLYDYWNGTKNHAAAVTNNYNGKSSGWKWAKSGKTAKASRAWSWRGNGSYYCRLNNSISSR